MPWFEVEALEKLVVRTTYRVEAVDRVVAVRRCMAGGVGHIAREVVEGEKKWVKTLGVKQSPKP